MVIVGKEQSVYYEGKLLTYGGDGSASLWDPCDMIKEKGMAKVKEAVRRLFRKLTELSLPFSIKSITVEQDPEVRNWRYVVAEVELNVGGLFPRVEDFLIEYVYSSLEPKEATKLLLILHNV